MDTSALSPPYFYNNSKIATTKKVENYSKSRLKMSKIRQKWDQIFKRGESKIRSSPVQQKVNQNMDLQQLQAYLGLKSQWVGSC